MDTQNSTTEKNPENARGLRDKKTLMSVLAYVGPLIIISYLTTKDDPTVKYHIKQGLVLVVLEAAVWLADEMLGSFFWPVIQLAHFALIVLSIIGIVNVLNGRQKELPFVGHFSEKFNI
ncbi:MAG: hypothetical protein V4467_05030 [Patescibacteria group bacterium]